MSKKKKIIISVAVVCVLLISIITTVILVNIKRYNMRYQDEFSFNNHTKIEQINYDASINPTGYIYNNGTRKMSTAGKYGVFSYVENKMIIPTIYKNIEPTPEPPTYPDKPILNTPKSYFKVTDNGNKIIIFDEKGNALNNFHYDEENKETKANIKTRDINYKSKKDQLKTKINNKFVDKEIKLKDIELKESFYEKNLYFYEIWNLTTIDNITYQNLYEVTDNEHKLIQTLNNEIGIQLDNTNLEVMFLTNGKPMLLNYRFQNFDGKHIATETEVYDINFNIKGSATINNDLLKHKKVSFKLGDSVIDQYIIPTSDKKYDYAITSEDGQTQYFQVLTYKLSLKNADYKQITFDYLINKNYSNFNIETTLLNVSKIDSKKLSGSQNIIINEKLQIKPINYEFNHIKRINSDRYIASIDGNKNFNLIDEKYNLISHFESCDSIEATNDSIIARDGEYYYICNLDGIIVKKYSTSNITLLKDDKYYLRKEVTKTNESTIDKYYLEQLGYSHEEPIYEFDSLEGYKFKGEKYNLVKVCIKENFSLIITLKQKESTLYDYSIYTIEGELLTTISNKTQNNYAASIAEFYSNNDWVVISFAGEEFVLDK